MKLTETLVGTRARLIRLDATLEVSLAQRLQEMGFTPGITLTPAFRAPFGGTLAIRIRSTLIALREVDAQKIEVEVF